MKEGKIINFDFKKNIENKKEESKEEKTEINEDVIQELDEKNDSKDFSITRNEKIEEKEDKSKYIFRILDISDNLKKINNLNPSKNAYNTNIEIVKKYTTEELFQWVENSHESEYLKRPGFFLAISHVLKERTNYRL